MPTVDILPYPIVVLSGALDRLSAYLRQYAPAHRYAVVTDDHVATHYLERVWRSITLGSDAASPDERVQSIVIPAGEHHKTREQWAAITDNLLASNCGRDTAIIALGGGVIGDLAGFVAATYMRGIPVVQIPTTLLAMVDASVGGKTAVDTPAGKNTVGAFHPPAIVIIDPSTLATLPQRELRSGLAEVIKHGVIAAAAEIDAVHAIAPALVAGNAAASDIESLIERSVRIKATVVSADERESGLRKVLNFGHTIGHGVEAASEYALLHGEAIAIGMVAEARLAEREGVAEAGTASAVEGAVTRAALPAGLPPNIDPERVLTLMRADKKQRRGALEYAVPKHLGAMAGESTSWSVPLPDDAALDVLRTMR